MIKIVVFPFSKRKKNKKKSIPYNTYIIPIDNVLFQLQLFEVYIKCSLLVQLKDVYFRYLPTQYILVSFIVCS